MKAFLKAVSIGSLAGGAPFLLATIPLACALLFDGELVDSPKSLPEAALSSLLLAVFPVFVSLLFVFPASLIFGLPLAALLRSKDKESTAVYVVAGLTLGFLIPLAGFLLFGIPEFIWASLLGAFSGAVTGNIWARERGLHESYI